MKLVQWILVACLRLYHWILSPLKSSFFGPLGRCRFMPSCSQYALEAIQTHGARVGTCLAISRLCHCHPWGGCGHDPVPVAPAVHHPTAASRAFNSTTANLKMNRSFFGCWRRTKV